MQEKILAEQIARYISTQYPRVIYRFDLAADLKLTIGQATRNKKLQGGLKGYPDLFIAESRKGYNGLFLELKADNATLYLKDGTLSKSEHIQRQAEILKRLQDRGYQANFAQGFDDAKAQIDKYLIIK